MSRLDFELKKMKKKKARYELPIDFSFWKDEDQWTLVRSYRDVMKKHTIFKSRRFHTIVIIACALVSLDNLFAFLIVALYWAGHGIFEEGQILDKFEKVR